MSEENVKGRIRIERDEYPQNPREECCNLGTMACFHKRYELGDKHHDLRSEDFDGWDEMEAHIRKELDAAVVLPLYLYDHSGITMNTTGFSCPWDSGQVGFIFITKARAREEYGKKRLSKKLLARIAEYLTVEVEVYDQYLTDDVYAYVVETQPVDADEDDGWDVVDSCGGFYGDDLKKNGMMDCIREYVDKGYEIVRE